MYHLSLFYLVMCTIFSVYTREGELQFLIKIHDYFFPLTLQSYLYGNAFANWIKVPVLLLLTSAIMVYIIVSVELAFPFLFVWLCWLLAHWSFQVHSCCPAASACFISQYWPLLWSSEFASCLRQPPVGFILPLPVLSGSCHPLPFSPPSLPSEECCLPLPDSIPILHMCTHLQPISSSSQPLSRKGLLFELRDLSVCMPWVFLEWPPYFSTGRNAKTCNPETLKSS